MPRLSFIIPSIGRASLQQAIRSVTSQMWWDDEIIVVFDHENTPALTITDLQKLGCGLVEDWDRHSEPGLGRGGAQRKHGQKLATGTHLYFLDDDDELAPGAVPILHEWACDRPVIFRMNHPLLGLLWREPVLEFGNVGTPMFLIPNSPSVGAWVPFHGPDGCDFSFIQGTCALLGDPIWREEIICDVRPQAKEAA